jgi:hypothetical protein
VPALRGDGRSRRVVVVPDSVVNPAPGDDDVLSTLAGEGWGVIALPPLELQPPAESWLEAVVDEVVTFLDADYEVALLRPEDPAAQAFINKLDKTGRTAIRVLELDDS